ncbi:MAG: hypothetical protein ACTSYU_12635 [Promethearchaeota archaeon]
MYVGIKEESVVFCQMELVDYTSPEQKTILDLENPQDQRAASRILKPKGLSPKRRRKKGKKKGAAKYLPFPFVKKSSKTKTSPKSKIKAKTKSKAKPKSKSRLKLTVKSKIKSTPESIHHEPETKAPSISPLKSISKSPSPPAKAIDSVASLPSLLSESKSQSTVTPELSPGKIDDSLIAKFGHSGEILIPCPVCEEDLGFHPEDLDSVEMWSTRLCDCGAIVRISTRQYYLRIFQNLGVLPGQFDDEVIILPTHHHDLNGNLIFSYGVLNE